MSNFTDIALSYHAAGLKVIPFSNGTDGKKMFPANYARFREAQTDADIRNLFAAPSDGICLLCTDNMEAIDIDVKHDAKGTIAESVFLAMEDFDMDGIGVLQKTKSGGYHIIYRCEAPEGNQKLARRRGEKEAMIETRGMGGLLFVAPTPGYEIERGDLLNIPTIEQHERDMLLHICRHFNEPEPVQYENHVSEKAKNLTGEKPWDAYDKATDILQLMEGYGWKVVSRNGDYIRLNRPGAKHSRGVDATVIPSSNLFYPFTSSEAFDPNKAYGPSSVYAIQEHRGDFSAAAKALYKAGFGDRIDKAAEVKAELPELIKMAQAARFDMAATHVEPKPLLKYIGERDCNVAGRGMIGIFTGHEKSGKSFVASCIAASGLKASGEVLNFSLDLDGGKMLWFDTEQSGFFFHKTQERIHRMAGASGNVPQYDAYHLRKMSAQQRIEVVEHFIYNTPGVSVVVIDGFVDLIADYNDLKEVQEYVGRLMRWSDERQVLILGVLHVNKGDGKIRGHIGSELKNKCDFIVNTVRHDNNCFSISNPTSRYVSFPDADFTRDQNGMPVYESHHQKIFSGTPGPTPPPTSGGIPLNNAFGGVPRIAEEDIPF